MTSSDGQFLFVDTDAIAVLIKNRAAHVPPYIGLGHWLASCVVLDALELGCQNVSADVRDGWYLVSAEKNWVKRGAGESLELGEIFRRILMFHHKSSHEIPRHEAFLMAYAQDIRVVEGRLVYRIKGADLPESVLAAAAQSPFCVAFRIAEDSQPAATSL